MAKNKELEVTGTVIDINHSISIVKLDINDAEVEATLSGKMRINHINVIRGDKVTVELSPYDLKKGRIIYRNKQ